MLNKKSERCLLELLMRNLLDWSDAEMVVSIIIEVGEVCHQDHSKIKRMFFKIIRMGLDRGLIEVGDLAEDGFLPWHEESHTVIERLNQGWDELTRLPSNWELCWIDNTPKGDKVARENWQEDE